MASRYVALIRGINVGRAKRVSMAALRDVMARLGYPECRTLLNSGNVVFAGARAPRSMGLRIERAVEARLGVSARVVVLDSTEFAAIMEEQPLRKVADNPSRLLVAFVREGADLLRLTVLEGRSWEPEVLAIGRHAAYLWCPGGGGKSPLLEAVGRALGDRTTTRNWATATKLQALLQGTGMRGANRRREDTDKVR